MAPNVSARIDEGTLHDLQELELRTGSGRSEVLRDVLREGIARRRLTLALDEYAAGRISLGAAAELAHLPVASFLERLRVEGVHLQYGPEELAEDVAWAGG